MLSAANHVIGDLPAEHRIKVLKSVRRVRFNRGQRIHLAGEDVEQVYFVEKGIAALAFGRSGEGCDVAIVGPGGVLSASAGLGSLRAGLTSFARTELTATAMEVGCFEIFMSARDDFRRKVLADIGQLLEQMEDTVHANARLTIEQRIARWLLMASARLNSCRLNLTHAEMAAAIGCNRPALTIAMKKLKARNVLGPTRRNRIEIKDLEKLVQVAEPESPPRKRQGSSVAA